MKKIILLLSLTITSVFPQNASDYFPSAQGMKWYYKTVPFDSLNRPVDSLTAYQIDTFAYVADYNEKLSNVVLSKYGTSETILQSPWLDTGYIHTETSNIWNYISDIGNMPIGIGIEFAGWYSVFRLNASTLTSYNIFRKDTLITIDSVNYTLRIEVNGRRTNDQAIITPYGEMNCKKIIISPTIKIIPPILPIPITLLTMPDTVYLAPGYYIVRSVRPTASIDLSLLGFGTITIPGRRIDAIEPPPVLGIDSLTYNVSAEGDTVSFTIKNDGEGIINWSALVLPGSGWLSLKDTAGTEGDTLTFFAAGNDTSVKRFGMIRLSAEGAFNSPRYISVIQEEGEIVVSSDDYNPLPGEYSLGQNYPNPFNPLTNIDFVLKSSGKVRLLLFDMLGNTVAVITDRYYISGRHSIQFNAEGLSSGVYIYRILTDGYTASAKMVVLK